MSRSDWVAQLQEAINSYTGANLVIDGIAGPATLAACPTLQEGNYGDVVRCLKWGMPWSPDPKKENVFYFGPMMTRTVKSYQYAEKLVQDGIVGRNTWRSLLKDQAAANGIYL